MSIRWGLVVVASLIVYGSLFPFDLSTESVSSAIIKVFMSSWTAPSSIGDILGNIALFIPVGILGQLALPPKYSWVARFLLVLVLGSIFACGLQVLQLYFQSRNPVLVDVNWNMAGLLIGTALTLSTRVKSLVAALQFEKESFVSVLLIGFWIGNLLVPFVPSIDFQLWKNSLKPLFEQPEFYTGDFARDFPSWLAAGCLGALVVGERWLPIKFAALVLATLVLKIVIVENELAFTDIMAGGAAILFFGALSGSSLNRIGIVAALLLIGHFYAELVPFESRFLSQGLSWTPSREPLTGSIFTYVSVIAYKIYFYGALVWLLKLYNLGRVRTAIIAVLAATIVEVGQLFVDQGTPEITDPLLAFIVVVVIETLTRKTTAGDPIGAQVRSVKKPKSIPALSPRPRPMLGGDGRSLKIGGLDGLRALAALAVFGVHYDQRVGFETVLGPIDIPRLLANGNTGVALFFILAGFLLSIPFWQSQISEAQKTTLLDYIIKRAARIVPIYYVCITALAIYGLVRTGAIDASNLMIHYLFLFNFSASSIFTYNPPFWTLAVEAQFYLLLPLLFLFLRGAVKRRVPLGSGNAPLIYTAALAVVFYVLNFAIVTLADNASSAPLVYSTLAHLPHFLIGVGASWIFFRTAAYRGRNGSNGNLRNDILFWLSAGTILIILSTPLDTLVGIPNARYNFPAVPLLIAVILITVPNATFTRRIFDNPLLVYLGTISYGIYIYHFPILGLVASLGKPFGVDVTHQWMIYGFLSLGLTIAVASGSYFLIERPSLRWARNFIARREAGEHRLAAIAPDVLRAQAGVVSATDPYLIKQVIRLRPRQAEFLRNLSAKSEMDNSEVLQKIVDIFLQGDGKAQHEAAGDAHFSAPFSPVEIAVFLRDDQLTKLEGLSQNSGKSVSRTIRFAVECFIRDLEVETAVNK